MVRALFPCSQADRADGAVQVGQHSLYTDAGLEDDPPPESHERRHLRVRFFFSCHVFHAG